LHVLTYFLIVMYKVPAAGILTIRQYWQSQTQSLSQNLPQTLTLTLTRKLTVYSSPDANASVITDNYPPLQSPTWQ